MTSTLPTPMRTHTDIADIVQDFRSAFGTHPAGVAIITADPGTGPVGMTATSISSVSMDPPAIALNLSAHSRSSAKILESEHVIVHLLGKDNVDLAKLFSTPGADRFADTSTWNRLPTGEPYLVNSRVWMRGKIIDSIDVNGSRLAAIRLVETHIDESKEPAPLVYYSREWHALTPDSNINPSS
ncbi:flavin reductase family protein [Corynebacterium glutamicum]|uniref:flavin reductase family protein n=1 Tax=Corynebacterium glutamicum TaxID=1718 RepID=UPI0009BD9FE8|nr:flavin reductase family protein [Corynebacterium glutamicum]